MKWFMGKHRETGEVIGPLAAEDDQDAPGGYDPEVWAFTPVDREKDAYETFDEATGAFVLDEEAKALAEKEAAAKAVPRLELIERIETLEAANAALTERLEVVEAALVPPKEPA